MHTQVIREHKTSLTPPGNYREAEPTDKLDFSMQETHTGLSALTSFTVKYSVLTPLV